LKNFEDGMRGCFRSFHQVVHPFHVFVHFRQVLDAAEGRGHGGGGHNFRLALWRVCAIAPSVVSGWRAFFSVSDNSTLDPHRLRKGKHWISYNGFSGPSEDHALAATLTPLQMALGTRGGAQTLGHAVRAADDEAAAV
jgi:hypothetical protein